MAKTFGIQTDLQIKTLEITVLEKSFVFENLQVLGSGWCDGMET